MCYLGVTAPSYEDWLFAEGDMAIRRSIECPDWGQPVYFVRRRSGLNDLDPRQESLGLDIKYGI